MFHCEIFFFELRIHICNSKKGEPKFSNFFFYEFAEN